MTCAFPDSLKPFPNIQYKYITVFFFATLASGLRIY